jgi:hypothetical protein
LNTYKITEALGNQGFFFLAFLSVDGLEVLIINSYRQFTETNMLKNLFDFSKRRSGKDAVIFYVFYVGCFVILSIALGVEV